MESTETPIIISKSGASSSKVPQFSLIPRSGLVRLATRYEVGAIKHGKDNWRKAIGDRDYAVERLNHVVAHALLLIDKLEGRRKDDGDDDAGAIMWGGCTAGEIGDFLKSQK